MRVTKKIRVNALTTLLAKDKRVLLQLPGRGARPLPSNTNFHVYVVSEKKERSQVPPLNLTAARRSPTFPAQQIEIPPLSGGMRAQ